MKRVFISEGHLIDSGIVASILNLIVAEGADYTINEFIIGKTNYNTSKLEIEVLCETENQLNSLTGKLVRLGCYEKSTPEAVICTAEKDKCAPEDFYSTTNHRTEVLINGKWLEVAEQRMDGLIVIKESGPVCKKLREIKKGDKILCSSESVRVFPPERVRNEDVFGFMTGEVSSERSVDIVVEKTALQLKELKEGKGKVVAVAGPVVVHTGGGDALASLVRCGYIQGLLAGNALAVHDVEQQFFGTSLGIDIATGRPSNEGHKNHVRAINRINSYGSIAEAVRVGALKKGIMYEVVQADIPYCLAGSIRDDGPLPETETDMIKAQEEYAQIIKGADFVLMLSSMLHSIGTGNMLPSWVKTLCVDINPAAVTKLSDRGSGQAIGIVSDVGLFLRALAQKLGCI